MERTREAIEAEINGYKQLLEQSDYKALKHADGVMTDEEWEPVKAQREELRAKINACEAELETAPSAYVPEEA
jgi:hypothetical protein|nr:MAG TPA: hypothetical protein [Caudoviricetes sp.]